MATMIATTKVPDCQDLHDAITLRPVSPTAAPHHEVLRTLQPVAMQPAWRPNAVCFAASLQRIDSLDVVRAPTLDGTRHRHYVVRVRFQQPHSRIPTAARKRPLSIHPTTQVSRDGTPDRCAVATFSAFSALRDAVHGCVTSSHTTRSSSACAFCEHLSMYLTYTKGRALAFAQASLDPTHDASALLESFLNELLRECQRLIDTDCSGRCCRAQGHAPFLLYTFLHTESR